MRKEVPGAPTCPTVNCEGGSGNEAYQRLLTRSCNAQFQCTETNCRDDYLTLRMVHDTCDHGALSQAAEEGLHALEEPCAAFQCNMPSEVIADTLICTEAELEETKAHHGDGGHNHGDEEHNEANGDPNQEDEAPIISEDDSPSSTPTVPPSAMMVDSSSFLVSILIDVLLTLAVALAVTTSTWLSF